jgi:ubiquinone/menaquinone biosynthesis C-methylase UbiE
MTQFKDLFSIQAKDYAKFRPTYPRELFDYLMGISQTRNLAWDVGCGNGQAAVELAKNFERVIATDPSEKQITQATLGHNIEYRVEAGENSSLNLGEVNLITVAQAFHWFDHQKFAEVCSRVAAPHSHLAVWTYAKATISPEIDLVVDKLYTGILENFWEKERKLVEQGYRTIKMPFEELETPAFKLQVDWNVEQVLGYFKTWSALQSYLKVNNPAPVIEALKEIEKAWGKTKMRQMEWPLSLRVWKMN